MGPPQHNRARTSGGPNGGERASHASNIQTRLLKDVEDYNNKRSLEVELEESQSFDGKCRLSATELEERVNIIIKWARRKDALYFKTLPPREGFSGHLHPRFAGDRFLSNREQIVETILFVIASKMAKGAHLHIHFNACLPPKVLLDIEKGMDRMFITSDLPLVLKNNFENYDKCEIQFSILSTEKEIPRDLFAAGYQRRQTMCLSSFLTQFPDHYDRKDVDLWLLDKLVFREDETHNLLQTAAGQGSRPTK